MELLDFIIQKDHELMIFLNNLGSETWDLFWIKVTDKKSWIPLFALLIYLIFKAFGTKKGFAILLMVAVAITFADQFTNLIKNTFERIRPCNDPSIYEQLRILHKSADFSFFSGHAANSFANTTFLFLLLRKYYKYIGLLFIWPILFAYSRVYIGVHYPLDIFSGMIFGLLSGFIFYKISMKILNSIDLKHKI
ncbi:MAG: phosphatase PAP2 family protein [Flavobacteriaceae bacterium]|nr:phosphatase PAP2 family protein [Flavobacteriaceae bacterium]